jgi:hypothetical protein
MRASRGPASSDSIKRRPQMAAEQFDDHAGLGPVDFEVVGAAY